MSAYRVVWLIFCGVLGVAGAVVAFSLSVSAMIVLFICAAATGGLVAMVCLDPADTTRLPRDRRRIVATSTVVGGAATVACIGLGALLGARVAFLLLAITAGGSPYAIRYCLHWLAQHAHSPDPPLQPDQLRGDCSPGAEPEPMSATEPLAWLGEPPVAPSSLSDNEPKSLSDNDLCLAWRTSYSALQRATSPSQRLRIVEDRRAYLDELERRNAHGMAAWLASGARAAGDPSRFVLGDSTAGRTSIDWDGLIHGTDK
jgi:hypothetical protein